MSTNSSWILPLDVVWFRREASVINRVRCSFDIRCSYDCNRFETPLAKLGPSTSPDSVVQPTDVLLRAVHRRQLWAHGVSSISTSRFSIRPCTHFCRLAVMFSGMPVAVVVWQPSLATSVVSRLVERRKRRAPPPEPSRECLYLAAVR
jgi:hypothetical protein